MNVLKRFQFTPAWKLSWGGFAGFANWLNGWWRNGLVGRGGDEWGNPSVYVVVPLLGQFVFFYGRNFDRSSWFLTGARDGRLQYLSPDYRFEAWVPPPEGAEDPFDWAIEHEPTLTNTEVRSRTSVSINLTCFEDDWVRFVPGSSCDLTELAEDEFVVARPPDGWDVYRKAAS